MRIGEVARRAGVSVEAVRFYETKGLIDQPPKPVSGGYREYSRREVERILFARNAQKLGFSLREIVELLALETGDSVRCADVRERATAKLDEVESKIETLARMKGALEALIDACPGRGSAKSCSILDATNSGDVAAAAGPGAPHRVSAWSK